MEFDAFLQQAWADHADRAAEVAERLEEGYALIGSEQQIAALARILAHVDGEHLARWDEGAARLERLRSHPCWSDEGAGATVVRRLVAAMRIGGGHAPASGLAAADLAHANAVAASAFAAQERMPDAIARFRAARAAAANGLPDGDPAVRALAVTANNLASALEEAASRSGDETAAMLDAARASREFWARAGGWLEAERALYVLARCHLAAGDAAAALGHAERCLAICEENGADDFERCFAHGAVALAQRALGDAARFAQAKAAALAHHAALPPEQRRWCEALLRELEPTLDARH
jgi:hypothetical protein